MKKNILLALFLLSAITISAQNVWKNDAANSYLGFSITHLGIADVPGHFDKYDVKITSSKSDFSDAVIEMTADVNSINTRVTARDNHLKSADFFDGAKYPTMTFVSTSVKNNGKNKYLLTGDLSMHGVTKTVTVNMLYRGSVKKPNQQKQTAGIQISGTIKRSDFGVGNSFPPPMLSDEIQILANGELIQQ